ncbi:HD family hydrolase [Agrobacterium rhizogenes]|uniref:Hydrolase protein n=2 Tax=Rhizobium rhizogenes TaxID=359 RepID=B9JC84_RHIR8|nr:MULTISPECIES: HD family hydrolase [Rhizobium]ACM26005.1 hydrolase protein [Rhizobium rhizogenes K84]KAA6491169.1 HD family hydrolase [Agrobacterium sp. ICMP 7243]OCJ25105.1 hydrolase [Agrobacterium sp. B131/95]EJK85160.1 putative HD superfamily hydrolase [Rhizobium sp. AP16]MDJ1632841.1 HD family hydrolase [Rhizobium rhizogenes]
MTSGATPRAWQRMLSGRRLDLLDPSPLDVEISDIAHGLARVARWNGQTSGDHAFSVAQHSLVVEAIFRQLNPATPDELLAALLHDAPEYVIGDMISPFKSVVGGEYKLVEMRLEAAIYRRFALPPHCAPQLKAKIKKADTVSAYFEATLLAGFTSAEARKFFGQPRGITQDILPIQPMPAVEAQRLFLKRFEAIEAERASVSAEA